jgi:hypothetical protein
MSLEAITLLIEPPRVDLRLMFPSGGATVSTREFYRYERFAAELRKHTSVPITVVDDFLRNAPATGMLLVHSSGYEMVDELPDDRRQEILARVVLMQADGGFVMKHLEKFRCAAAILKRDYMEWSMNPDAGLGLGVYGLRSIAPTIGANCEQGLAFASENYCYLTSDRFGDLPSQLIGYLEAVAR